MKMLWGIALSLWGQAYALPTWQPQILSDAARLYEPAAQAEGLAFQLLTPLDQTNLIASADNDGSKATVQINGGVLSSDRLTPDSLRITLCHELGHIFGGALRRNVPYEWSGARAPDGMSLLSSEGEADYYATLVCFRRMVDGQDHRAAIAQKKIPALTKNKCEQAWGVDTPETLLCERTAIASFEFLTFVYDFPISLEKNDAETVTVPIIDNYPSRQCRLDTLVAGSLCRTVFPLQLDRNQAESSDCVQLEAKRPACWYPQDDYAGS